MGEYKRPLTDCPDGIDVPPLSSDCADDETTVSHPPPALGTLPAWDVPQAGPSYSQAGPCPMQTGSSQKELFLAQIGLFPSQSTRAGLTQAYPSLTQSAPCPTDAGPSHAHTEPPYLKSKNTLLSMALECIQCKKVFATKAILKRHIHTAHEENPTYLECGHCGRNFLRKDFLRSHIQNKHSSDKPEISQAYPSLTQSAPCPTDAGPSHAQTEPPHSKSKSMALECKQCKKVFSTKAVLKRHIHTAHEENPTYLECGYCGRNFLRKDCLRLHLQNKHSSDKPVHPCFKCGKRFSTARYRNLHCQIYCPSLKEQPLLDTTGDDCVAVEVDVNTHEAGEQIQPDVVAEPGPSTASSEQPPNQDKGIFSCSKCGSKFTWKSGLRRHLKHECGVPLRFSCPQCSYKTPYQNTLEFHMFIKHGFIQ